MTNLAGRRALVTGASRGIGRAIAIAFSRAGARVAINHLGDAARAAEVAREIADLGGEALVVEADVGDEAAVDRMFDAISAGLGRIDILVNNAGILLEKGLIETTAAEFDRVIATNLRGTFLVSRRGIEAMLGRDDLPRVINLASDLGYLGRESYSAYSASKGAILALTRSWAREFAPEVLVNAIAPGPIETDMLSLNTMSAEWIERERNIPLARFGRPEEVAAVALFLAGPGARFMTGQCLGPNGGSVMP